MMELTHTHTPIPQPTRVDPPEDRWFLDSRVRIHADGLVEQWGPKGDMPPLHVHHHEEETFHILEGALTLFSGDQQITAAAGSTIVAPRGIPHTYCVESPTAHWLVLTPSAEFSSFVADMSEPAPAADLPPRGRPVDPAALGARAAQAGIEILGPPGAMPA